VKEATGLYLRQSDLGIEPAEGPADPLTGQPTVVDPIVVRAADGSLGAVDEIAEPVIRGSFDIEGHRVTTAYDLLLERCSEWTPEKASALSGIPADTIYELARDFAEGPSSIYLNMGMDHLANGAAAYHALFALSFVTGQFGKPGAGVNGGGSFNMSSGVTDSMLLYPPGGYTKPTVYDPYLPDALLSGEFAGEPFPLKSLYFIICNPLITSTGRRKWLEAIERLELIIVADVLLSDTARYADIVLPVPHYFERWDISYNVTPSVSINEKAIEPLYDCKTDLEITNALAQAMGFGDTINMTFEQYAEASLDTDRARELGITWESLKQVKNIYSASDGYNHGQDYSTFTTPTRRGQFYLENVQPLDDYGQIASGELDQRKEALPYWEPPAEAWHENPLHEKYPLQIMSWRSRMKTHTQFTHCQWLLELWPEPVLYMNSDDAAERGISTGDLVKAYNDRGHMVCKAVCSNGICPGTVLQDHGWAEDQFIEGCYPDLIGNHSHPASNHDTWFDVLCQVEKA
jgi:molybdopterin-containing oxidoreductase family molybdopterin binding subunit